MPRLMYTRIFYRILLLLAPLLLLSGCSDDKLILERLGFVQIAGYDKGEEGKITVTYSIPLVTFDAKTLSMKDEVLTASVTTIKGARSEFANMSSRILVNGHLRAIIINTELAREGLIKHLDTIIRDPTISRRAAIALTEEKAQDLIKREFPRHSKTGRYIDRLLQKEFERQVTPEVRVHQFLRDTFDSSRDAVATVLDMRGNDLKIAGVALFSKDKYVGKISARDANLFMMMYQQQSKGEITLDVNSEEIKTIAFTAINSSRKIKVSKDPEGKYKADVYINAEGGVLEYIGPLHLSKVEENRKAEQVLSKYMEQESERIIHEMQSKRADGLGIGTYYRNKIGFANWKRTDWHEVYSKMPIQVHFKFRFKNFGSYFD